MDEHIFRQYDIRGIVGEDLDAAVTESVGRAFASMVRAQSGVAEPRIAVGNDNRLTSADLVTGLIAGIRSAGVNVLEVGTVPTPVLYWTEATFGTDAAVQITGSHNPPEWNGIKMSLGRAALYGDAIQEIRARILNGDMDSGSGAHEKVEVLDRYVTDVVGRLELARPMTVAAD
jgi:phosphomannomutase/phosphoglucomutase